MGDGDRAKESFGANRVGVSNEQEIMTATHRTPVRAARSPSAAGTAARLGAALAVFVSGLIHLQLYFDGYRDYPDENLGRSFLLNAVAGVVLAVALVFRRELLVRALAAALLVGTLVAFIVSRTETGIFGLSESGLNPSPQAAVALVAEIVGLVLLAATLVPAIGPGEPLPVAPAAVVGGLAVIIAVGGAIMWSRGESAAPAAETASDAAADPVVSISDFTFNVPSLQVPVGTTVEWINNDSPSHSIVAEDGSFRSPDLASGDRFTFTFERPGTFAYTCGIHPTMGGEIVVID
jgi:plastocyanin